VKLPYWHGNQIEEITLTPKLVYAASRIRTLNLLKQKIPGLSCHSLSSFLQPKASGNDVLIKTRHGSLHNQSEAERSQSEPERCLGSSTAIDAWTARTRVTAQLPAAGRTAGISRDNARSAKERIHTLLLVSLASSAERCAGSESWEICFSHFLKPPYAIYAFGWIETCSLEGSGSRSSE
jgi:hypothetical protein